MVVVWSCSRVVVVVLSATQAPPAAMRGTRRLTPSLAGVVAVSLFFCPAATAATRTSTNIEDGRERAGGRNNPCTTTASAVAQTAHRLCGGAPIEEALLAVRLQPGEETDAAGRALAGLGLRTALDLQLMQVGGPFAMKLMDALAAAEVSLGDRAKIRLLVGDRPHFGRLPADAAQDLTGGRPAIRQPQ